MIDQALLSDIFMRAGAAASNLLSQALGISVEVSEPSVSIASKNEIASPGGDPCMLVCTPVDAATAGVVIHAFHPPLDTLIPELIINPSAVSRPPAFTELHRGAGIELMSRYWGMVAPVFADAIGSAFKPQTPEIVHMPLHDCLTGLPLFTGIDTFVYVTQQLRIKDMASGRMSMMFPASFVKDILGAHHERHAAEEEALMSARTRPPAALGSIPAEHLHSEDYPATHGIAASPAHRAEKKSSPRSISRNVEALLSVPMEVIAEIGCAEMEVDDVMSIAPGRVVELDQQASNPIGLYVNGKLVARGRVVTVGDNFGVEIMQIVQPSERLMNE